MFNILKKRLGPGSFRHSAFSPLVYFSILDLFALHTMSRALLNTCRYVTRQYRSPLNACLSTSAQRLHQSPAQQQQQQQQQTGKTTHFGFRDVAEEEKESLGRQ